MNSTLKTDGYKVSHYFQYPKNTEQITSNWTPRKSRIPGITHVIHFGLNRFIKKYLIEDFNRNFFQRPKSEVVAEYKRVMDRYIGKDKVSCEHIAELHDLGYLPIKIKSLPEGSRVPMRCPIVTIKNTNKKFFWITNYIETLFSSEMWGPTTSATISREYRKILNDYAKKTGNLDFVQFQGHDFSFRGMYGVEAAKMSGMGHLLSFVGTDTIPAILELEKYYGELNESEIVGCSVPATEHAVMCAGGKENELETFRRLITEVYPDGIVSIVSDSWNLWTVLTEYVPELKDTILNRNGKLVIRPDSGDPVKILCGYNSILEVDSLYADSVFPSKYDAVKYNGRYYKLVKSNQNDANLRVSYPEMTEPEVKGVIQLLYENIGGTVNNKGYIDLDPHIGAIYGDSITIERSKEICEQLMLKGFSSTNVVFGIGSYTYQYVTRDTFGFAMKATHTVQNGIGYDIFKSPITDSGEKKSAKGLIRVDHDGNDYVYKDQCTPEEENGGLLETVFLDGKLTKEYSLSEIRERVLSTC